MTIVYLKPKLITKVSACRVDNFSTEHGYGFLNYQQISAEWTGMVIEIANLEISLKWNLNDWTLSYILNGKDLGYG